MAITVKTFKPTSHAGSNTDINNITSTYDGNENTGSTVSVAMLSPAVFVYTIPLTPGSSKRKLELEVIADNDKSDVQIEAFNPTDDKTISTTTCGGGAAGSKKKYIFDVTERFDGQAGLKIKPTVTVMAGRSITVYEVSLIVTSEDEGVRKIFLGSSKANAVKLGTTNVSKVYLGNALIFMFKKLIDYASTDYSSFTYGSDFVPI